jgi:hypothetical protein
MEHGSPVVVGWEGTFGFLVGGWVIESIPKDQCQQPKARRAIDFSTAYLTHLVRVYCARRMRNDDFSPMS